MPRYASHFYLRADGSLGKFPVVEVDADGVILQFTEAGDSFTETASVSFFGGLMVPGLIAPAAIGKLSLGHRKSGYLRLPDVFSAGQSQWDVAAFDSAKDSSVLAFFHERTRMRAIGCGKEQEWGVLATGAHPGIVVVEGFDLNTWKVIRPLRYRIIVS